MVVKNTLHRFAFTMIELIFAIVVISIVVVSIPVMTQVTSKGIESNIVQEAIFAASAELMGATSYYWDLNSMQDSAVSHLERVINIGAVACENNSSSPRYRLRPGHVNRRCLDEATPEITADNSSGGAFLALEDAAVVATDVMFVLPASAGDREAGYKENYNSIATIAYVNETGAADANVKKIIVRVTNSNDENITILNTYCANIGEIDYYKRRF